MRNVLDVLHVEDDDEVASATGKVLKLFNPTWRIERVDNLDAGMDLLKANPSKFKLIILDLRLPGGYSGLEVLKIIVDSFPTICTVIYSGTSDPDMEDRAFMIGVQSYIYKPCDGQELYRKLNRAVVRFYGTIERCTPKVPEIPTLLPEPLPAPTTLPLFDRNAKIALATTAITGLVTTLIAIFGDALKTFFKWLGGWIGKH